MRSRRTSAGRIRSRTAAGPVLAATALLLSLAGCADPSDHGNWASRQGGPATRKPSPKPAPAWRTDPASVAALGDSITVGFDACSVLADCPRVSWATGTDPQVNSVARRLLKDPVGHSWNLARTGALMSELPAQVDAAVRHRPELVTILIGANDACRSTAAAMTPVAGFRADFRTAMTRLRRALPKTQVYVAAVPDLMRLWSQGRTSSLGKEIWKLGICGSMLRDPDDLGKAAADRRLGVRNRVMAYNAALKDVCAKDRLCRYDRAVFDYRFTTDELSGWDWFHPGREGQRELAALAHREITRQEPAG
ncbi:SGNH/GDSL hydrolase family protein [Streptomyces sp. MST-110588]|uniref:SGNH/GDSL hydrolase family protein n=1 Tax=Streptomyces sp. MST-110588 TaxID=2833628 RepID=UPI001F5DBC75|nr:SGNH/GDSL hydrolase family protein [Streptomyces sp. MST-110588]